MMRPLLLKLSLLLMMFAVLFSCKPADKPVEMKKMSRVLVDMHLAESYAQFIPKEVNETMVKNTDSLAKYNEMILRQHGITAEQFKNSIRYYNRNPDLLDSIYQMVLAEIAIVQAKENK